MTFNTFTLKNGVRVLAKDDGYPFHYANRTQAAKRAAALLAEGAAVFVYKSAYTPSFYVAFVDTKETE